MGGGFYACVRNKWMQIRRFYYSQLDKEERPTKEGIVLTHQEWERLKEIANTIDNQFTDIAFETPCFADSSHRNHLVHCYECNPFQLNL